jgi:signal transduction histidine kinase
MEVEGSPLARLGESLLSICLLVVLRVAQGRQGFGERMMAPHAAGRADDPAALRTRIEELEEIDRRKNRFLGKLAHEVGNYLLPVQLAVQIMKQHGADPAVVGQIRELLEEHVPEMGRLVDKLRDVSRATRNDLERRRQLAPAERQKNTNYAGEQPR